MSERHPSDLALEGYLLEPGRSPLAAHLETCEACRGRLARMRDEGEDFRRFVFPATVEAVERAAARRRVPRWPFVLAPTFAAAAVAAVLLLRPSGPDSDYVGVKGRDMTFSVFVNAAEGARAVPDGAMVPASAEVRFRVRPKDECWLWIMSVDESGVVSRLYPPKGVPPDRRAPGPVPGGAVLDGLAGPERIYAVCAPDEKMGWGEVKSAAEKVALGGAERVRAARGLGGSLSEAPQASLLLEKRP